MKYYLIFILVFSFSLNLLSQEQKSFSGSVDWNEIANQINSEQIAKNSHPIFIGQLFVPEKITQVKAKFKSIQFKPLDEKLKESLDYTNLSSEILIETAIWYDRKNPLMEFSFIPFRKNPETGSIEQVTNFDIEFDNSIASQKNQEISNYKEVSVLNTGNWYKIKVDTTGVFKITYEQMLSIGLKNPENIRVYSHFGKQLPYMNNEPNYDDLVEMPISMSMGGDNKFNEGDYILFYTQGPVTWKFNESIGMFTNLIHNYSNYTYLFLSTDLGSGLRIPNQDTENINPTKTSTSFDSYRYHEKEMYNLIRSGRTWYGEKFRPGESLSFGFNFPQIISTEPLQIYTNIAGRREKGSPMCSFKISNDPIILGKIDIIDTYSEYIYGHSYSKKMELSSPSASFNLTYGFEGGNSESEGYINFICLNAREKLKFTGAPLLFRDTKTVSVNSITEFIMENDGSDVKIWDVTSPESPIKMNTKMVNQNIHFIANTNILNEYVAFKESSVLMPILEAPDLGFIENQNLHGIGAQDMIILAHPDFLNYAEELAQLHRTMDSLRVYVTTPDKVYNEFSSGTPDVSAIRNFMRMLYNQADSDSDLPRYLLLFGDGSYDNKTSSSTNSNFLLTYQSVNSLSETSSYISDDFYGLLDDAEGEHLGKIDLGIGRFPVQTKEEARLMLDKVYTYLSPSSMGDWRTRICFIGDDGDGGTHMIQPENIAKSLKTTNPEYNINRIYLDAYTQISTPSGQRYPDVTKAINDQVAQGALIIDYVGHGNPRILTHEEVLSTTDVRNWTNINKLPIFVTASCEVGRFDDYSRVSMGEYFLLNQNGGGIAALTTTRLVYSGANDVLNTNFFNTVFNPNLRLGDVIRITKVKTPGDTNQRNFSLLGDPALKLAIPENINYISTINNLTSENLNKANNQDINYNDTEIKTEINIEMDTLNALSLASVSGYVLDKNDLVLEKDGIVYISVFDKSDSIYTYGQDNQRILFQLQNKLLYKGQASIKMGFFNFEFIVPKDINFKFDKGKISLYAKLDSLDAIGYSENFIVGGNSSTNITDDTEPVINLFLNDTLFINGGTTDQNPILLAKLSDEFGINTTGNGFGHNITAVIDDNQDNILILNNFYQGYMDKFNSGEVTYPLKDLTEGYHSLYLKAWDIFNNSSDATIEFYVVNSEEPVIENLSNYPNPFKESTEFVFDHNQAYPAMEVTIDIFDLMGNKVTQIIQENQSSGFQIEPITWYGTNNNGSKLANGIYIYKTTISTIDGTKTSKSSKLMIFR